MNKLPDSPRYNGLKIKPGRQHHSPVTVQLLKLYSISEELEISCQIDHNGLNDPFKVDAIVDSWARFRFLIIDQNCLLPSATKFAGQGPSVQFADGTQKAISKKIRCSLTLARLQRFLSTRGFLSFAVDPLCYTLLYPFGDEGFSLKLKSTTGKKNSETKNYLHRLCYREGQYSSPSAYHWEQRSGCTLVHSGARVHDGALGFRSYRIW
jgi:hypothetical protein